jgi:hypothetical protein
MIFPQDIENALRGRRIEIAAGTGLGRGKRNEANVALDRDLSTLPTDRVDLWIYLEGDAIFVQIMAAQAERLGFPMARRDCAYSVMTATSRMPYSSMDAGKWTHRRWPSNARRISICAFTANAFGASNAFTWSANPALYSHRWPGCAG